METSTLSTLLCGYGVLYFLTRQTYNTRPWRQISSVASPVKITIKYCLSPLHAQEYPTFVLVAFLSTRFHILRAGDWVGLSGWLNLRRRHTSKRAPISIVTGLDICLDMARIAMKWTSAKSVYWCAERQKQNREAVSFYQLAGQSSARRPARAGELREFCERTSSAERQSWATSDSSLQVYTVTVVKSHVQYSTK